MSKQKLSRKRLQTLQDVRRYLASLINRLESGDIEESTASKLAYISNILISCIKDSDIEARLKALEDHIKNETKGV